MAKSLIKVNKILDSIGRIYDKAKECRLVPEYFESVDKDLRVVAQYFNVNIKQALVMAFCTIENFKGDTVDLDDMITYFDCNPVVVISLKPDIDLLYQSGLLDRTRVQNSRRKNILTKMDQYALRPDICDALIAGKPLPALAEKKMDDLISVLAEVYALVNRRDEQTIDSDLLMAEVKKLILKNLQYPLLQAVSNFKSEDAALFLYIVWKSLAGSGSVNLSRAAEEIFDFHHVRIRYIQEFIAGKNMLVSEKFVDKEEGVFSNDSDLVLTGKSIDLLKESGVNYVSESKKKDKSILDPADLPAKELIYSADEERQVSMIREMITVEKLKIVRERLNAKNLPLGVAILLHGKPGTGKTETAFQLAKHTGRQIMKVEISQTKSMWYGQSEKIVKSIFNDYNRLLEQSPVIPILLINEADAILGKRKESPRSSVEQTDNTIQNIFLEELENFKGILIATTNLVDNLDKAFERRFLFKVRFESPAIRQKAAIWKLKLPVLTEAQCAQLAMEFNFTGGEIDNVVRKFEVSGIINEIAAGFDEIVEMCREEHIHHSRQRSIGYLN